MPNKLIVSEYLSMVIMFWLSACTNIRCVSRIIMRFKLKLNKHQMTCYPSCFPKSELCALNFVTEKCVTSRVRLGKPMPFAWNILNFHYCLCQSCFVSIFSTEVHFESLINMNTLRPWTRFCWYSIPRTN